MMYLTNLCLFIFALTSCERRPQAEITELRCQSAVNPTGIDDIHPVFSWITECRKRGKLQSACQIIVADSREDIDSDKGTLWDSGKILTTRPGRASYNGKLLASNRTYYWKVKIWDEEGEATSFSSPAQFTTSILDPQLWQARWIGRGSGKDPVNSDGFYQKKMEVDPEGDSLRYDGNSLLLRRECKLTKRVTKAMVHVCGLGLYEFMINGEKIGNKVLNPAKTNYNKIVLYDSYDVTGLVKTGDNVFCIMLGNGWFNPIPKWWSWRMQWFGEKRAMMQMHIIYADGTDQVITTDDSWKLKDGPVRNHCLYDGETYDAARESDGWCQPHFDDSGWMNAKILNPPKGKLTAQTFPAIRRIEVREPQDITYPNDSVSLVDLGQNFSGWIRIKIKGNRGDSIFFRYAEDEKDGMLFRKSNNLALATDTYIVKGLNEEVFEPRFTYHGFRYVEVRGLGYPLLAGNIEGVVIHSAVEPIGSFDCSNENINKIHKAVIWSQRSNLMGYPTDCPQREERLGWLGDAHVTAEEAIYNFDMNQFYAKWLKDIRLNQVASGDIPFIAPRPIYEGPAFSWSCGFHLMNWYHYLYYGDKKILEDNFDSMKRYVDYLSSLAEGFILPGDKYGDWASPLSGWKGGMPMSTSTIYYYYTTTILAKSSQILGYSDDAKKYSSLAENIKNAFNQHFFNEDKKSYDDGSQFANSFPLFLGIVPEKDKEAVLNNLINDIQNTHEGHLTTGILGTKYLMEALSMEGRSDVAWRLATQTTYPGWISMLENRTTLSEHWIEKGMNSHNHVMFGSIDSWFYKTLGGIRVDENAPGFRNIIIKPYMPDDLTWVKASIKTANGIVSSAWTKSHKNCRLKIKIPFGSEAVVYIPALKADLVKEGYSKAKESGNVLFMRMEENCAVFKVGSGEYSFVSHLSE